jgi:hypothetical protein
MQRKEQDQYDVRCDCGRELAAATVRAYSSRKGSYLYRRCACGRETTEHLEGIDLNGPVTVDELLDVHLRLAGREGTFEQLLGLRPATS